MPPERYPDGHFYSPVVDQDDLRRREDRIWAPLRSELPGISFNDEGQRSLLVHDFPRFLPDYTYPHERPAGAPSHQFYEQNGMFGLLDSRALFVMLRKLLPRRMIEVGSGFSTLLSADVNCRFLGGELELTCIEPYPPEFLHANVPGVAALVVAKVQDVPAERFDVLEAGDVLFIDSSHVSKVGSDVNYLVLEILPRLKAGVVIHFHDVFLPDEYPKQWVLGEWRSWNEQYLLRALLMYTTAFEIMFGCAYAYFHLQDLVEAATGGTLIGGGSLWLRRI